MAKTIYECYRTNGHKAGFWVRRNNWDKNSTFFVKRIGQQTSGRLVVNGPHRCNLPVWGDAYRGDMILSRNTRLGYAETLAVPGSGKGNGKDYIAVDAIIDRQETNVSASPLLPS